MQDKKKIVIGALCALIMVMAVGYALLSQQLSINGSASITSNWQVEITNITEKEKSTGATTNNTNYTATTASFNTSLTSPGDYALYEVTVTNSGTLDAVLSAKPTVTTGNNTAITYELEGIKKGDKILKNNQTDTFTIKVTYNSSTTTQPSTLTSNIEVTLSYEQDLGQVGTYDEYVIGDKITFAGSNWYVIKNSTDKEDYVVAMKERNLTASEIGNSYSLSTSKNGTKLSEMAFYWSDTCHLFWKYGLKYYSSAVYSGCSGHNDYQGSKIKEAVEEYKTNYLDVSKLKELDGYMIRLVTLDELITNLGYDEGNKSAGSYVTTENVPSWVYSFSYWTMTPNPDDSSLVWAVYNDGHVRYDISIYDGYYGVRPVINLLKSAIE